MPSSSSQAPWRPLQALLAPFDGVVTRVAVWSAHGALVVLILTGETLRWVDYRDTLIAAPTLRAVHALAGFVLALALALRLADTLLRGAEALLARWRGQRRVPAPAAAFHPQGRLAARLLDAAWWAVVGLLMLSGLERFSQLRHGTSLLPGLSPSGWWALHRPMLPYLYALLLINGGVRGRLAIRRAMSYLYTP